MNTPGSNLWYILLIFAQIVRLWLFSKWQSLLYPTQQQNRSLSPLFAYKEKPTMSILQNLNFGAVVSALSQAEAFLAGKPISVVIPAESLDIPTPFGKLHIESEASAVTITKQ